MQKSFLFITPLTPKKLLTPLRKALFEQFIMALNDQSYQNWQALLIGEEEKTEGNIKYVKINAVSKEIKLIFAKEYILGLKQKPDYIIRIDDDDIINPNILEKIAALDFDCYADNYHTFYDLVSGKISQQKRSWLANTVIHKYEHAMKEVTEDNIPLLQADHSKEWIKYYSNKTLIFSQVKDPVYLRVLSPTTVTSGVRETDMKKMGDAYKEFMDKASAYIHISDMDLLEYNKYLKGFGKWKFKILKNYSAQQKRLDSIWEGFSQTLRKNDLFTKLTRKWNSLVA